MKCSLVISHCVKCCVSHSVQFSCSVMSDCLRPHEPQHARPLCPSPTLGVYPDSCPLSQWCHPAISSSVIPFSSLFQSFPASGSFQMSQLFASSGQSIGVSALVIKNLQMKNKMRYYTPVWMAAVKKADHTMCWQGFGESRILIHVSQNENAQKS